MISASTGGALSPINPSTPLFLRVSAFHLHHARRRPARTSPSRSIRLIRKLRLIRFSAVGPIYTTRTSLLPHAKRFSAPPRAHTKKTAQNKVPRRHQPQRSSRAYRAPTIFFVSAAGAGADIALNASAVHLSAVVYMSGSLSSGIPISVASSVAVSNMPIS